MVKHLEQRITSTKSKETFHLIRRKLEISKNDLLTDSGFTVSTLTRVLEELVQAELIVESGFGASTGGRRPILYRVNPQYGYAFGFDLSRTMSRLVMVDASGQQMDSAEWTMNEEMTPEVLLPMVISQVQAWIAKYELTLNHVLGLGIGAVGPVDRFGGIILNPSHFPASGWENVHIVAQFEQALHVPILLDNGANAALWAESWANRTKDLRHMLYVHLGIGIRSAMTSEGNLIYGAVDMEDALGQMIIKADGAPPRTANGNYGSLESYTTIYALEREVIAQLRMGRPSVLQQMVVQPELVTFPTIMEALRMRDPLVSEVMTQTATYFGIGLANLLNILHPEKVVLGGPLILGNDLFFYTATQTAIRKTYHYPNYQVVFSKGSYGEEALAVGAALLVLERLTAKLSN
ncbi:ROK family protein [Paenibacillus sp. 481]|uniref:ROK family protein n=1 Tax=Paenibacillus sp. 481 TaxID=2835869 RepID=UPI001E620D51|nr:ROK family protein [Paenibacillus sp. 481]UHA74890.1 ROK family protein [Paenibacillus sp. 481]